MIIDPGGAPVSPSLAGAAPVQDSLVQERKDAQLERPGPCHGDTLVYVVHMSRAGVRAISPLTRDIVTTVCLCAAPGPVHSEAVGAARVGLAVVSEGELASLTNIYPRFCQADLLHTWLVQLFRESNLKTVFTNNRTFFRNISINIIFMAWAVVSTEPPLPSLQVSARINLSCAPPRLLSPELCAASKCFVSVGEGEDTSLLFLRASPGSTNWILWRRLYIWSNIHGIAEEH